MSSKRIKYVDMLKAFCIILVIAGHMGYTPTKVKLLLYIFHIPLFFFFIWNDFKCSQVYIVL